MVGLPQIAWPSDSSLPRRRTLRNFHPDLLKDPKNGTPQSRTRYYIAVTRGLFGGSILPGYPNVVTGSTLGVPFLGSFRGSGHGGTGRRMCTDTQGV